MSKHLSDIRLVQKGDFRGEPRGVCLAKFNGRDMKDHDILLIRYGKRVYVLTYFVDAPELKTVTDKVRDELFEWWKDDMLNSGTEIDLDDTPF